MSFSPQIIEQFHTTRRPLVVAVTGGGTAAVADLLHMAGASRTVLDVRVPWSSSALADWLGRRPERFCCRDTALLMGVTAWWNARALASMEGRDPAACIGAGCTASLVTLQPHRGNHRCWIAIEEAAGARLVSLTMQKGHRSRKEEDRLVSDLLLYAIAQTAGLAPTPDLSLSADETVIEEHQVLPAAIQSVRDGSVPVVWSRPDGSLTDEPSNKVTGFVSGAFHPLHHGHTRLRDVAADILQGDVVYELPIVNADKPPLDSFSIEERRRQFTSSHVALTSAPRFMDKAKLLPNSVFVIGFDTAERVLDPRFYGQTTAGLHNALETIREHDCRFLVAGRMAGQQFHTLDELSIPDGFGELFQAIPASVFRDDISSTQIRMAARE